MMNSVVEWLEPADWMRWDRFVAQHPWGSIVHTSAWKRAIEQSFHHIQGGCCVLVKSGAIVAGLPIYKVSSLVLGTRLVSVPFATVSDPIVSDEHELSQLLAAVRERVPILGASRIEVRCAHAACLPSDPEWQVETAFKHHTLPLDRSEAELLRSTHPRAVRAMILRAERTGLLYRADSSASSLRLLPRTFLDYLRRLALPPIPFAFFRSLHEHLVPLGAMSYAVVEKDATPVAVGLVLKWPGTSTIEYLGDRVEYRCDGANQMLYWGAILEAKREDRHVFSFGRTAIGNLGLLQYKRRWGTREIDLPTLHAPPRKNAATTAREQSWQYRLVSRLCATAPRPIYQLIGKFCYRHMG